MSKSIAVFGAGPALGRAVAHRYAREGTASSLVARRRNRSTRLAGELQPPARPRTSISADLADVRRRARAGRAGPRHVGDLDALYYGAAAKPSSPPWT